MMRMLLLICALTAAAGLASAAGASSPRDAVVGSGAVTFPDFPPGASTQEQFDVSAHAGPGGEGASGTIAQHSPHGDVRAEVTCLRVDGDDAIVGGTIVEGTYLGQSFPRIALWIRSGGPGAARGGDALTGLIFSTPWADPCARFVQLRDQFPQFIVPLPLDRGAFTVTDAD